MNRTLGKRERRNQSNFVYSRVRIQGSTSTCTCADKIDKPMGGEEDQSVKLLKIHLQLMTLTYLRYNRHLLLTCKLKDLIPIWGLSEPAPSSQRHGTSQRQQTGHCCSLILCFVRFMVLFCKYISGFWDFYPPPRQQIHIDQCCSSVFCSPNHSGFLPSSSRKCRCLLWLFWQEAGKCRGKE